MSEAQFILWLKGFLSGRQSLSVGELDTLKQTISQIIRSTTNESTSAGKQMLHG